MLSILLYKNEFSTAEWVDNSDESTQFLLSNQNLPR